MGIVKKYRAEVVSVVNPIEGVYTVELRSLDKPFKYEPGQFLHLAIDNEYDGIGQWPNSRCFSMQSNPSQDNIKITYAIKGDFTKHMERNIKINSEVWLKLPYGDLFQQPHSKVDTVFIAGGTGITPFLSLFTHYSFKEYINPHIYIGFRSNLHNIYNKEFMASPNPTKKIKVFIENIDGILDIKSIFNENGSTCSYFISGPPIMIKNFKQALNEKGVPNENILTDDWG